MHPTAALCEQRCWYRHQGSGRAQATDLGRIASHYYVKYTSLATYNEHLKQTMGDIELLRLFALSGEFRFVVVREEVRNLLGGGLTLINPN